MSDREWVRCEECKKWDIDGDDRMMWGACYGIEVAEADDAPLSIYRPVFEICKPDAVRTFGEFGCPWGEKPNPLCPACESESVDGKRVFGFEDYRRCGNPDCRCEWFREDGASD